MKNIQDEILDYIKENNDFPKFDFLEYNTTNFPRKLKLIEIFHLIESIANNCYKYPNFYDKIEKLILYFLDDIKEIFSTNEIFDIFSSNKRILLFLFQEGIIKVNSHILTKAKAMPSYYSYLKKAAIAQEEFEKYDKKRKIGENDCDICRLIQNDSIVDFIKLVNQENINLNSLIPESIFETNPFLVDKRPTLIEYAAFFGSIQIIQYMALNNVKLTSSLWIYSIHSNNPELINYLESNDVKPPNNSYEECLIESIKCFWSDLTEYFNDNKQIDTFELFKRTIQYHNYSIPFDFKDENLYFYIKFDYPIFVYFYKCYLPSSSEYINRTIKDDGSLNEETLLSIAVEGGYNEIVNILLSYDAIDVNQILTNRKNNNYAYYEIIEKTALSIAVHSGNREMVQILLTRSNADINLKISYKKSKFDYDEDDDELFLQHYSKEIDECYFTFYEDRHYYEINNILMF